jgi:hypothetical protein
MNRTDSLQKGLLDGCCRLGIWLSSAGEVLKANKSVVEFDRVEEMNDYIAGVVDVQDIEDLLPKACHSLDQDGRHVGIAAGRHFGPSGRATVDSSAEGRTGGQELEKSQKTPSEAASTYFIDGLSPGQIFE